MANPYNNPLARGRGPSRSNLIERALVSNWRSLPVASKPRTRPGLRPVKIDVTLSNDEIVTALGAETQSTPVGIWSKPIRTDVPAFQACEWLAMSQTSLASSSKPRPQPRGAVRLG